MNHFTLLKSGIDRWNQRRASQPNEPYSLAGQDLREGYFFEGNFTGISLKGADLRRACLIGANFSGADLSDADLSGAYLSDAVFTQANLSRANLTGANLERVDLRRANLFQAQIADANIDPDQLPNLDLDATGHVVRSRLVNRSAADQFVAQSPGEAAAFTAMPAARFSRQLHLEYATEPGDRPSSVTPGTTVSSGSSSKAQRELPASRRWALWGSAIVIGLLALTVGLPLALNSVLGGSVLGGTAPEDSPIARWPIAQQVADSPPEKTAEQPIAPLTVTQSIDNASQIWGVAATQIKDAVTLFGGDANGQIKIWNEQGDILQTLNGHDDTVRSLAVSESGKWLVSSSSDAVKVWRPATGKLVYSIPAGRSPVWAVAISPDEQTLISSDYDGVISVWQLNSGKLLYSLEDGATVWSVAIAPDSQSFVTGSSDQTVRQWDLASGELLQTLTGHRDAVRSVAIDPQGKTAASGSWDGTVKIWNLATGELQATLDDHGDRVVAIAISPDGKTLASGSIDHTIKRWNLASYELIETLNAHTDWVLSLAFVPLSPTLISGSKDSTVNVWQ